jgi:hypothetical protein
MEKLPKETIDACRRRSKAFKVMTVVTFFLFVIAIFLLTWYARNLLGYSLSILVIIARLVFAYVARKEGYAKQISPKYRRVQVIVSSGFFVGFAIIILLRLLLGRPLPSPYFLWLFLTLIVIGAYIGDKVGRKLKLY